METNNKTLTMVTRIGVDVTLHEISEENREYFKPYDRLGDYHEFCLKTFGDTIAPKGAATLWLNGCYMWFVDSEQEQVQRVFQTENGILIFDDIMIRTLIRQ